jgi:hypothetical protein
MSSNLDKRIKIKTSLDENAPPKSWRTGRRQFARLRRLPEDCKITLTLDAAARDWLAAKGWDPPTRRTGPRMLNQIRIKQFIFVNRLAWPADPGSPGNRIGQGDMIMA